MAKVTLALGGLLVLLGIAGFVLTGATHYTALIPTYFGVVLEFLGLLALIKPKLRMHVMHAAVLLALIGMVATVAAIPNAIQSMRVPVSEQLDNGQVKLSNGNTIRPAADISKSIMAILCSVYIALAIMSFIAARRNRDAAATGRM